MSARDEEANPCYPPEVSLPCTLTPTSAASTSQAPYRCSTLFTLGLDAAGDGRASRLMKVPGPLDGVTTAPAAATREVDDDIPPFVEPAKRSLPMCSCIKCQVQNAISDVRNGIFCGNRIFSCRKFNFGIHNLKGFQNLSMTQTAWVGVAAEECCCFQLLTLMVCSEGIPFQAAAC